MIICNRCGKENQDHYKFCLGCGAELTDAAPVNLGGGGGDMGMMKTMMADVSHQIPGVGPVGPGSPAGLPGVPARTPPGRPSAPFNAPRPSPGPFNVPQGGPPPPAGPPPGVPSPVHGHQSGPSGGVPDVWARREPSAAHTPRPEPYRAPPTAQGGPATAPSPQLGASGPRACGTCGSMVPPAFKFCGVCGNKMEEAMIAPVGPSPQVAPGPRGIMTLIRPDGSEGGSHSLTGGENKIGRDHGDLFENDGYLSPTHAVIIIGNGSVLVRDLGSLNGVFVKMTQEEQIRPGQVLRIGQELLRFDLIEPPEPLDDGTEVMGSPNPGYWGKISVMIGNGVDGSAYPLLGDSVTLGRERGEINFPDDGYVSGLHARLSNQDGRILLSDMGSSNGTFIKIQNERSLGNESFVLLGQQLFRVNVH